MGKNLSRAPLLALLFASLITFFSAMMPFSEGYKTAESAFRMPVAGYLLLVVYGLWLSLIMALLFHYTRHAGVRLMLLAAAPFLGVGCLSPMLEQLVNGQPTGIFTTGDTWLSVLCGAASTLLLLLLGLMTLSVGGDTGERPGTKYSFKTMWLIIKVAVAPIVYMLLYVVLWYFLAWRSEAVRLYYTGGAGAENGGFWAEIINMLLTNAGMLSFALLQGLLLILLSLPLLLLAPGSRLRFLILNTMLYMSHAVYWLVPGVAYSDGLRAAQFWRYLVLMLLYGLFSGILLHTSLVRQEPPESAKTPPEGAGRQQSRGQVPTRRPAARR